MTWARLDDHFHAHPKLLQVGLAGSGLYARALAYCADYETDGHVPYWWVQGQITPREDPSLAAQLENAGLWQKNGDGFVIRDYLEYNPSAAELEAEREAGRRRARQSRERKRGAV